MTYPQKQDTPFKRANLSDLPISEIEKLVESMRERRMRSYTAFEAAKAAKEKLKEEKDRARYEKLLTMAQKKYDAVDKGLDVLGKYLNEMKVLELVLGSDK